MLSSSSTFLAYILLLCSIAQWPPRVLAFDFTFTAPTQCDNLNISWTGGSGPYSLLITPFFHVPINISLPDSAFNDDANTGTYSFQLTLPVTQEFLLTMSDATGFASGGTSDVLTVGSSVSGASCNTAGAKPAFTFELNSALQQCEDFTFEGFNGSAPPVAITGLIPLGQAFELQVPSGADSFDWVASVSAGTSIAFLMVDGKGRSGGSSDLRTVDQSNDSSCLNASSPHSTADTSSTPTSTAAPSATQTIEVKTNTNTGAIVGAVLGGLACLGLILLGALLYLRRRRRRSIAFDDDKFQAHPTLIGNRGTSRMSRAFRPRGGRAPPSFDLLHSSSRLSNPLPPQAPASLSSVPATVEEDALPNPYILPSTNSASVGHSTQQHSTSLSNAHSPYSLFFSGPGSPGYSTQQYPPSVYNSQIYQSPAYDGQVLPLSPSRSRSESEAPRSPTSVLTSPYSTANNHGHSYGHTRRPSMLQSDVSERSGKISNVGQGHTTSRFILHTDLDDPDPDADDGVVELPPRYNDRRLGVPTVLDEKGRTPTPPTVS